GGSGQVVYTVPPAHHPQFSFPPESSTLRRRRAFLNRSLPGTTPMRSPARRFTTLVVATLLLVPMRCAVAQDLKVPDGVIFEKGNALTQPRGPPPAGKRGPPEAGRGPLPRRRLHSRRRFPRRASRRLQRSVSETGRARLCPRHCQLSPRAEVPVPR